MKVPFLRSIRGKMATSYTLVTVLIVCLVLALLAGYLFFQNFNRFGTTGYISEVVEMFSFKYYEFFDGETYDTAKMQSIIEEFHNNGYISLPGRSFINTNRAKLIPGAEFFIIDTEKNVVASVGQNPGYRVGEAYKASNAIEREAKDEEAMLDYMLEQKNSNRYTSQQSSYNNIRIFIPIGHFDETAKNYLVQYIVVFTVEDAPPFSLAPFMPYVPFVLIIIALTILIITPFGVVFGLIAGRGLTKRISRLAMASEQLAQGQFEAIPLDKSKDEIGQLNRQMRNMSQNLQQLMQNQQEFAAMQERTHLARELHDTVKQQNFATQMQIRAAQNLLETDTQLANNKLIEATNILRSSQDELSNIIRQLRPASLEDRGLAELLRQQIRQWCNRNQIPVQVNISNERRIPLKHEQALLRVAQEALSNIARHSKASMVWFTLDYQPEMISMSLQDNGVGFSHKTQGSGMGMQNMQARIEALGGWFGISSSSGQGTMVIARLPLEDKG